MTRHKSRNADTPAPVAKANQNKRMRKPSVPKTGDDDLEYSVEEVLAQMEAYGKPKPSTVICRLHLRRKTSQSRIHSTLPPIYYKAHIPIYYKAHIPTYVLTLSLLESHLLLENSTSITDR